MEEIITLLESSLNRTKQYIDNYNCCTISAFRPRTNKENKKKSAELGSEIRKLGYIHFLVGGNWIDNFGTEQAKEGSEITYFVVNSKNDPDFFKKMFKLGELFDQDAIMLYPKGKKPYLIGTSKREGTWPGYNKKEALGDIKYGKEAPIMTRVNGRPYHASIFNY